ncbi:MAG: hypothetical protein EXR72_12935 [Myxococcales bacterium]|nr:hypothetical protein [Myxococcales bacterium]
MRALIVTTLLAFGCNDGALSPVPSSDGGAMADATSPDAARSDAAVAIDLAVRDTASPPDAALVCNFGDPGAFPKFDPKCGDTKSCSIGFHLVDCCGTLRAIGFNHAFRDAFDAAEKSWQQICPMCDCIAKPTLADDGKPGTMQTITVACEAGLCRTHGK